MERISSKPIAQELIFKSPEENVFFDVLSASSNQEQEKFLGNLYVIGHVKYENEDLGYLVSLISSLAKREYYSQAANTDNPKMAFEHALKKLNEVLEEFFQNKKFNLNIGLLIVAGESIYLSKLGKFKVFLAREGEIIDIFNNVDLFQKDHIEEKEFSNIISGKTKINDTMLAFFPSRSLASREKQLKEILLQNPQAEFFNKIKVVNESAKNFSCCGVHIEIKKIIDDAVTHKTIPPVDPAPESNLIPTPTNISEVVNLVKTAPQEQLNNKSEPPILLRDVTFGNRANLFQKFFGQVARIKFWGSLDKSAKFSSVAIVVVLIFLSVGIFKIIGFGGSKETRAALQQAQNNLKLAQTNLSQNNIGEARKLVSTTLISLTTAEQNKKTDELVISLNEILDRIDLVKKEAPELLFDLSPSYSAEEKLKLITNGGSNIFAFSSKGSLVKILDGKIINLKVIEGINASKIFSDNDQILVFNGHDLTAVFNQTNEKITQYSLKNPVLITDSSFYEQNLYVLAESSIYKYSDITKGDSDKQQWLNDSMGAGATLITVDGRAYVFSSDGIISIYFKGKKEKAGNMPFSPSPTSGLLTNKNLPYLVYVDPVLKRIMLIAKESLTLVGTYKADNLNDVSSWSLDQDGTLYLLSSDQKIWKLGIK